MLHPTITTCMDELAILKHTGDVINLDQALDRKRIALEEKQGNEEENHPTRFYDFDYLA